MNLKKYRRDRFLRQLNRQLKFFNAKAFFHQTDDEEGAIDTLQISIGDQFTHVRLINRYDKQSRFNLIKRCLKEVEAKNIVDTTSTGGRI